MFNPHTPDNNQYQTIHPNAVIIQEVVQLKWSIFQNFQFLVSEIEKIGK